MAKAFKLVTALVCAYVFRFAYTLIFKRVVLLGGGWIGSGLAIRLARAGCTVKICELKESIPISEGLITKKLDGLDKKYRLKDGEREKIEAAITWTDDYEDACKTFEPDLLIDATTEDLEVKKAALKKALEFLAKGVPKLTVTSALPIAEMGFDGGFHPMSPPDANKGLEVVYHDGTSVMLKWQMWTFGIQLKLVPFFVKANQAGYAVNGIFIPLMLEACKMLADGFKIATIEAAFKEAVGIKVGAFAVMNFIGVPVTKLAAIPMQVLGKWLQIPQVLSDQIEKKEKWVIDGEPDAKQVGDCADRFRGLLFANALRVVGDVEGGFHNLDRAIRVCLAWPKGPGELMQGFGGEKLSELIQIYLDRSEGFPNIEPPEEATFETIYATRYWEVQVDQATGMGSLMLNNPEGMGALSAAILEELKIRVEQLNGMDCRICLVWSACGNFAGADIKEMDQMSRDACEKHMELGCETLDLFRKSDIIFIGVPHGKAVCGGGAELHKSLDLVVAPTTTKFWFPELIAIGAIPGWNGILNTVWGVGRHHASTALYQPDYKFSGMEAVLAGFANIVAEHGNLEGRLDLVLTGLLKSSPDALVGMKERIWEAWDSYDHPAGEITDATIDVVAGLFDDPDGEAQNRMGQFTRRINLVK